MTQIYNLFSETFLSSFQKSNTALKIINSSKKKEYKRFLYIHLIDQLVPWSRTFFSTEHSKPAKLYARAFRAVSTISALESKAIDAVVISLPAELKCNNK